MEAVDRESPEPISEVGSAGPKLNEDTGQYNSEANYKSATDLLSGMETILTRLLAATSAPATHSQNYNATKLITFDPDEVDADIEAWCRMTEVIVTNRKLEGPELLLALTHALKGRAAKGLLKLSTTDITWIRVKELLIAQFHKPKLMQEYFDEILKFQIESGETASQAAARLWNLIERVPQVEMGEDVITGFAISVLCQRDSLLRRELNSHAITTRAQLCRILNGIPLKRRHDDNGCTDADVKRPRTFDSRYGGSCHYCGFRGHKMDECRKRRENLLKTKISENEKPVICYSCGKPGHLSPACPEKKPSTSQFQRKQVNTCESKLPRGTLLTSSGYSEEEASLVAVEALMAVHQPLAARASRSAWRALLLHLRLDARRLVALHANNLKNAYVDGYTPTETMSNVVATLVASNPEVIASSALQYALDALSDDQLLRVTRDEYFTYLTPEGELYDKSAVPGNDDTKEMNLKRESKAYSYKDQLEELQLRRELEEKRRREGKGKEVPLSAKQKEAIKAQLAKESAIRQRLTTLNTRVVSAVQLVEAVQRGNPRSLCVWARRIVPALLGALRSPLAAPQLAHAHLRLRPALLPHHVLLGDTVARTTIR